MTLRHGRDEFVERCTEVEVRAARRIWCSQGQRSTRAQLAHFFRSGAAWSDVATRQCWSYVSVFPLPKVEKARALCPIPMTSWGAENGTHHARCRSERQ